MADILLAIDDHQHQMLRQRAEELSHAAGETGQATGRHSFNCLFFEASGIRYAVAQDWVQEVHLEVRPVPVPCTPSFVRGIVNVRGEIVSAVDLSSFLGYPPLPMSPHYQMFRLRKGKLEFGILCQQVENIEPLSLEDLHPFEHGDATRLSRYLLGVTDDLVNVLDVEALLADESFIVC